MVTPAPHSQDGPGEALNPYQAPAAAVHARLVPSGADSSTEPLRFWEGRKALLKSLFFMRCFALVTALIALRTGYLLVLPYVQPEEAFPLGGSAPPLTDVWVAARLLTQLMLLALTLTFSYIVWQFANSVQQIAGRHEPNPTRLCQQHLLLWRFKVAMLAAILLQQGISYVHERTIMADIEAMAKD
jgi:F0F1-type ATP synthase assembly protein I